MEVLYESRHNSGHHAQIVRLEQTITLLRDQESDLARMLLQKRITQDSYDKLRLEWQDKLRHKRQELESLSKDTAHIMDDLEAGISLLTVAPA